MFYPSSESIKEKEQNAVNKKKYRITSKRDERLFRLFDICVAGIGLIVLFPIMLLTFCLIKLENPTAPAIFKQNRIKKNGKLFKMYKFRSMSVGAEDQLIELAKENEMDGPMFKMEDDPRVTKLGKIIRKLSIDEFPQFINVFKGDMSVVGPRPALPAEVAKYNAYQRQRLQVKPGCTGLWQVSGRNKLQFAEMIELDLYYISNCSLKLNIIIILKTFKELTGFGSGV